MKLCMAKVISVGTQVRTPQSLTQHATFKSYCKFTEILFHKITDGNSSFQHIYTLLLFSLHKIFGPRLEWI